MNYNEALEYLTDLTKFGFNFGLGRITHLLEKLDNPHHRLKVIHIAGTNGKGSTAVMISSILQAAGLKVGLFTSPHLHRYTERTRINGCEISENRMAELITRLKPVLDRMVAEGHEHPTEFEVDTALSLLYFAEEKVDIAVLEAGLGGKIDSTNVVTPLVSVITNVAMDHMDYLGSTLTEIATVKAGIIKPGGCVVTAADKPEVLAVIEETCRREGADLIRVGREITWSAGEASLAGQSGRVVTPINTYDLHLNLLGRHQLVNAATAIGAIESLRRYGIMIDAQTIKEGIARARWPARLEIMRHQPLVLIDGAHNHDGARILCSALLDLCPEQRRVFVIGMLADKEREKVVAELAPLAAAVVVTKPNSPRAGDWQQLAVEVRRYLDEVYVVDDIAAAVAKGMTLVGPDDLLCITGSLYMVAEAREFFLPGEQCAAAR